MGRHLRSLLETLGEQQALLTKVRQLLPPNLGEHLRSAQLHRQKLVLHVDSPAWASRLRYLTPALLKSLASQLPGIDGVQVRIQPEQGRRRDKPAQHVRLSRHAARHLNETAAALQDPALSAALQRLARLAKD